MKNAMVLVIAGLIFAGTPALAQTFVPAQSTGRMHTITINLPDVLAIRMTNGTNNAQLSATPDVGFDYTSSATLIDQYLSAVGTTTQLGNTGPVAGSPTASNPRLGGIIVFSNDSNPWTVGITTGVDAASALSGTNAFPADQVYLTPKPASGITLVPTTSPFALPATTGGTPSVFTGSQTQGWKSLGVNTSSYSIKVTGTEVPGITILDVTYTFTAP